VKFRVERDVLAEAVTWVARGLPVRPAVPVLAGVLIEAGTDGTVTLSAFDYEVSARITVSAEVSESRARCWCSGACCPTSRGPCRPTSRSTSRRTATRCSVTCGSSRFALLQMPASDYPTLPTQPTASGTIDGSTFAQAVAQVAIAADRGDTLPILTGVRVEIEGEKVTFLATDRYRLAMREFTWNPSDGDASHVALIPARTLAETARARWARVARWPWRSGRPPAATGSSASRPGSGTARPGCSTANTPRSPRSSRATSETEAVVKTADLIEAVKRVALVAERNTPVRLRFSDGQVDIEAGTGDDAQASEAVEASLDGPEIEIAFNPGFLLDGLGALHTPYARFLHGRR
jgi:DNA polymerase-3 subunit beta